MTVRHALVARLDNLGDVLLAGPAVRAVAADADRVTFLAGPAGAAAAALLPGVDEVISFRAPWVGDGAPPVAASEVADLVERIATLRVDEAAILTSFHQSPLPLALVLRLAGVPRLAATSVDHPGSLLDHRLPEVPGAHEVEQAMAVAAALGHHLPPDDDAALEVRLPLGIAPSLPRGSVAVHPSASVPARALPPDLGPDLVEALVADGRPVVVTGSAEDARDLPIDDAHPLVHDLRGRTDLATLGRVLASVDVLVVGNTGPAHLAAAVGTPVVSVFAPVVEPGRWTPWKVPSVVLGDLDVPCAGCRARVCPLPNQLCLAPVTVGAVLDAIAEVRPRRPRLLAEGVGS